MQKLLPDDELLANLIIGRLKTQCYADKLRYQIQHDPQTQRNSLVISQEMGEVDLNWDTWNLWIVIYLQLVNEGLLNAADINYPSIVNAAPDETTEYDLRRIQNRQQNSALIFTKGINTLAYADRQSNTLNIHFDLLKMHFTKAWVSKISLDTDPKWESKPGYQLTSGAKLTAAQAKELETSLKKKLTEMPSNIKFTIQTVASQRDPGVHRALIELREVWERCYQHIVPSAAAPNDEPDSTRVCGF